MKIASFNINGIKARLLLLREWLGTEKPDVIGLQEIKADNEKLENNMFADLGYSFIYNGQKSYNGCGILSKHKTKNTSFFFPGNEHDPQRRWMQKELHEWIMDIFNSKSFKNRGIFNQTKVIEEYKNYCKQKKPITGFHIFQYINR